MTTHICPTCSQPCVYKDGIMCTITGCVRDGTQPGGFYTPKSGKPGQVNDQEFNDLMNMFQQMTRESPRTVLRKYKDSKEERDKNEYHG